MMIWRTSLTSVILLVMATSFCLGMVMGLASPGVMTTTILHREDRVPTSMAIVATLLWQFRPLSSTPKTWSKLPVKVEGTMVTVKGERER